MRAAAAGLALAAGLVLSPGARAEETGWSGRATVYGWLPVINGAQEGPDGQPLVDLQVSDVLSRLDMAFMGTFELRKDRFGLIFDAVYVNLSNDGEWLRDKVTVSTNTRVGMYTLAAAYRAYEDPKSSFDVYAGGRLFDTRLDFGVATDARGREVSESLNWTDPLVGLRGDYALGDKWTLRGFADVGGFDGSTDLSWQVYGGATYDFNDRWGAAFGYRYLSILYQATERAKLDIDIQGPLIGISYRF